MLTWVISIASMVRKLVYEKEIHLEEVMTFFELTEKAKYIFKFNPKTAVWKKKNECFFKRFRISIRICMPKLKEVYYFSVIKCLCVNNYKDLQRQEE